MDSRPHLRLLLCLAAVLACAATAVGQSSQTVPKQTGTPLTLKPDLPGMAKNHRLILKDGTYQLVRQYEVTGERVRYLSQERGDWEELPSNLVDWDATRRWEQSHATPDPEDTSPAMLEAAAVDRDEAAIRDDLKARSPEVAAGLELPDEDGVFVLDTFEGTPELVELTASEMSSSLKGRKGLGALNPLAGQNVNLTLDGAHSRIHLHVNDPAIYLSLDSGDGPVPSGAITVNTSTAKAVNGKHGARSSQSGFALVRVDERNAVRVVGAVHVSVSGTVTQDENVIPAKVEVLPGKHWIRLQPEQPLGIGEYALVEILSGNDVSQSVWDFRVDPTKGDNPGSLGPILKKAQGR